MKQEVVLSNQIDKIKRMKSLIDLELDNLKKYIISSFDMVQCNKDWENNKIDYFFSPSEYIDSLQIDFIGENIVLKDTIGRIFSHNSILSLIKENNLTIENLFNRYDYSVILGRYEEILRGV